jgi:hypothetical protein
MEAHNGDFQFNLLRLLAVALLFRQAAVNQPSSGVNVSFLNEQTKRILVLNVKCKSIFLHVWIYLSIIFLAFSAICAAVCPPVSSSLSFSSSNSRLRLPRALSARALKKDKKPFKTDYRSVKVCGYVCHAALARSGISRPSCLVGDGKILPG